MINKLLILSLFSLLIYTSCANQRKNLNQKNTSNNQVKAYKQIAFEKFGSDTIFIFSPEENYVLCTKAIDKSSGNPNALTEFFVYDTDNKEILYEDKIPGAIISWNTNTDLLIIKQKGIITSPEDTGKISYLINIKTKKRKETTKNNY